jgi:hypothetical protein
MKLFLLVAIALLQKSTGSPTTVGEFLLYIGNLHQGQNATYFDAHQC